jgi:hypothetical protein
MVTFDYYCAQCDATYCERVNLLNLALAYEEDGYCISCLVQDQQALTPQALVAGLLPYILSRDCFSKPWLAQNTTHCSRLATQSCFCHVQHALTQVEPYNA